MKPLFLDLCEIFHNAKKMKKKRRFLSIKIEKALKEVKKLSGRLPICSNCHKIRDDKGTWHVLESYIDNHSEALFSHGICPEC